MLQTYNVLSFPSRLKACIYSRLYDKEAKQVCAIGLEIGELPFSTENVAHFPQTRINYLVIYTNECKTWNIR